MALTLAALLLVAAAIIIGLLISGSARREPRGREASRDTSSAGDGGTAEAGGHKSHEPDHDGDSGPEGGAGDGGGGDSGGGDGGGSD